MPIQKKSGNLLKSLRTYTIIHRQLTKSEVISMFQVRNPWPHVSHETHNALPSTRLCRTFSSFQLQEKSLLVCDFYPCIAAFEQNLPVISREEQPVPLSPLVSFFLKITTSLSVYRWSLLRDSQPFWWHARFFKISFHLLMVTAKNYHYNCRWNSLIFSFFRVTSLTSIKIPCFNLDYYPHEKVMSIFGSS